MSYFSGNIRSKTMKMDTQLHVILPQDGKFYNTGKVQDPKTLILLHGLSDNSSAWVRYTALERYAEQYNLLIAMPEVQRSFYTDMKYGIQYEKYVAEELPFILENLFHTSTAPGDLIIAGLSMGGYGALKTALKYPEKFTRCGAFSAALSPIDDTSFLTEEQMALSGFQDDMQRDIIGMFGTEKKIPEEASIVYLAEKCLEKGETPHIFMTCGFDDFLYRDNRGFADMMEKRENPNFKFLEWQGVHEWSFWDSSISKMLQDFL